MNAPTSSSTGIPVGLVTAHAQVRDELARADTKANVLLSLVGAALAGVIALTGRAMPAPATVTLWLAAAPILASVLLLVWAICPRLNNNPVPGTWMHAAQIDPCGLLDVYQANEMPAAALTAQDVCVLGRIALTKYHRIRQAIGLLVIGLGVLAVALVLSAVIA